MYKRIIEDKKAVFFDMDGTLVNTEPMWVAAFKTVLDRAAPGITVAEVYGLSGEGMMEKWTRVLDQKLFTTANTAKELAEQTNTEFLKLVEEYDIEPREGFWGLAFELREEREMPLALTTNTTEAIAKKVLEKMHLSDFFDYMIFGDSVKKKKPDPEIYLTAAKALKIKPEEVLVFEDSIYGAQAANTAKMGVIVIWDGMTSKTNYPKDTLLFMYDFLGLEGNLDHYPEDLFRELEKKENERKGIKPQPQHQQTQTQPR